MIASKIPAFWHNPSHFIKFILPESGSAVLLCHIRHKTLFLIQFEGRRTCALIFIVWLEPQDITRWLPPLPLSLISLYHSILTFSLAALSTLIINTLLPESNSIYSKPCLVHHDQCIWKIAM